MGLAPKPYSTPKDVLLESDLKTYRLFARGKVRDVYEDGDRLLIVATDRISAFDYILPTGIPEKGRVLTQLTLFWLEYLKDMVPNHFLSSDTSDLPPEFARILKSNRALKKWFESMSPSMRKGFSNFIADAKTTETRQKRAESMAESLMLAMEGELEPPPILRAAFQRQPEARRGWDLMTPTQRKHHLLGIFYPQTVEGRERRAAKALESCLAVARRRRRQS